MRTCPQCRRRFVEGEAFCPYDGARLRDAPRDPTRQPEDGDPLVGHQLDGRYAVQALLGRGGMGTVYAGRQMAIHKPVAIKVLRAVDDDGQAMARFEREAKSASRLGHAHIVDIFDFGRVPHPLGGPDALAYLVMELLDGEDLGAVLVREGALSLERILPIVFQCCSALGAAHSAGIVHRDLKPENVFLIAHPATGARDHVKIVDFGLAKITETEMDGEPGRKLTQTGMVFGTPHYMPPEQCTGRPTDPRADIYALAIILYEALAGKPPFSGDTFMAVINQHLIDPPPPLREINPAVDVPPAVEAVIDKALMKLAEDRQPSMRAFSDELRAALVGTRWQGLPLLAPDRIPDHRAAPPPSGGQPIAGAAKPAAAFAQTAPVRPAVDPAAVARSSAAPIPLTQPKSPAQPPSGSGGKKVIPETRRAIDPVPAPEETPAETAARPRFSGPQLHPASTPPPRAPQLNPPSPPPRAPGFSTAPPPPTMSGGTRAVGWVVGGLLLLLVGGALGYLALLLAR